MDKETKKGYRNRLMKLLNSPNPKEHEEEIKMIGKILSNDPRKKYAEVDEFEAEKGKGSRGPYKEKFVDPLKYIELRKSGKSRKEICTILNISMKILQSELAIMRDQGLIPKGQLPRHKRPIRFKLTKEEFIEQSKYKSDSEIAREQGVSRVTVSGKRRDWGLPRKNKKITLTIEQYKEFLKEGLTPRDIERKLELVKGTIYRLKTLVWDLDEDV